VGLDKWGDKVERARLEMQCFKAAWVVNVLHEGLGMPRIVDPGGNISTHGEEVESHADEKGLGRLPFQSMDSVGDIAITWTLGKMVLEASKEVPPLFGDSPPLVDPLEDVRNIDSSPVKPIRPPFPLDFDAIEVQLSSHLPPSLSRRSLGFSFVGFVLYLIMCLSILLVTYRLRHHIRVCLRRSTRLATKRDQDLATASLEEGYFLNGSTYPTTPISPRPSTPPSARRWMRALRRLSFWHPRPLTLAGSLQNSFRNVQSSQSRASPIRSFSYPATLYHSNTSSHALGAASGAVSSPTPSYDDNLYPKGDPVGASSMIYSRSRNSSTISLSTLVPRQPISRTNSATL